MYFYIFLLKETGLLILEAIDYPLRIVNVLMLRTQEYVDDSRILVSTSRHLH